MSIPSIAILAWLRIAPATFHERLLSLAITHLLRGQPFVERLGELAGKRFRLCIDDADRSLTFEIIAGGLVPSRLSPHVSIRGALSDFVALALRQEDPDTLFFQRRLVVEGETETGLHLKNLLDGWEYDAPAHVRAVLPASVADPALRVRVAVNRLRGQGPLRRSGSHRNSRPAETQAAE